MKKMLFVLIAILNIGGCASSISTTETENSFAINGKKPNPGVTTSKIGEAIKTALQKNMSRVQINTGLPPSPLPKARGRFQLVNEFKGLPTAALAARSGQSLKTPTCEGTAITATSQDFIGGYGEGMSFLLCLLPHKGSHNIDIHTSFINSLRSFSAATLAATLAKTVVGDSSQFVPQARKTVVDSVGAAGATTKLL